jgi:predicted HicB family RNase H-like nuclease
MTRTKTKSDKRRSGTERRRKTVFLALRVEPDIAEAWQEAAEREAKGLSEWLREAGNERADLGLRKTRARRAREAS